MINDAEGAAIDGKFIYPTRNMQSPPANVLSQYQPLKWFTILQH